MLVHRFYLPPNDKGTVLFNWKFKLRESLKFELRPPESTQSASMEVSEYPDFGRVQQEQADDNVVTINRNKGKLFTVLGQRTESRPLSRASLVNSNRKSGPFRWYSVFE
jgi:O-succinylbenzoate synthase